MGWLRLVGSLKLQVSFAEYSLFYRALLQQRPIIWRGLLIVATPSYVLCILLGVSHTSPSQLQVSFAKEPYKLCISLGNTWGVLCRLLGVHHTSPRMSCATLHTHEYLKKKKKLRSQCVSRVLQHRLVLYALYVLQIKHVLYAVYVLQGGEDSENALSCRSFFAKEPLIIGLFCRK